MEVEFLCDELIQEILQRLPNSISSSTASLVCKRWLHLHRTSINSLSLRVTPNNSSSIPSFLSRYPHLSSLTIISSSSDTPTPTPTPTPTTLISSDLLLLWVASNCSNLHLLRFFAGPVSPSSLSSLSSFCKHLTSLHISSSSSSSIKSLSFRWLISFPFLKHLSFTNCTPKFNYYDLSESDNNDHDNHRGVIGSGLPLESLCLSGIGAEQDQGLEWLWRNCTKLRRLQLRSCEGIGVADDSSSSSFFQCLKGLQELELRACRTIVDGVLSHLSDHAGSLNSLLLYDGGSRDGLHRFISRTRSTTLQRLDFRLPLDLDNGHLSLVAENFRGLVSLRLQSCCLVTGEGLKHLGSAMNNNNNNNNAAAGLEELALINCDVVEREPGLLTTLGQNLRGLKKLDLSYNELMVEKGFVSMIVSCKNLIDIKLRGCKGLKNSSMICMIKSCKFLESVDIKQCSGIGAEGVEEFLLNASPRLRRIQVEESKLSDVAKNWVSQKFIEIVN